VAFVTSHPIQYQVPVFRHLATRDDLDFQVLFAMLPDAAAQGAGFGVEFEWDLPLLEGYEYRVLDNRSENPSVTHFRGCDTPSVGDVLKEHRIDAVVVNGWVVKTCLQTLRACKRLGIPCIVRGEANHLRPRAWWKRLLQRQLVRRYDAFLPIGSANRDFYRSYGIEDLRMFDARYCIENGRFERAAEAAVAERTDLRRQWGIGELETCFLFCGKFETKKHPLELVKAFEKACQSRDRQDLMSRLGASPGSVASKPGLAPQRLINAIDPAGERSEQPRPMRLLMVGDGELRRECEQYATQRNLPVTFTGFLNQSEIVGAYVASDCLVLPSDHGETWGLVVNEAFACGRPAITSDQVGCTRDLIREGETGVSFPFGDWDRLAACLVEFASEETNLRAMGQSAKEWIQTYSPDAAAEGIARAALHCLQRR